MAGRTTTLLLDGIWGRPRRFGALQRALEQSCGPAEIFRYADWGNTPFEVLGARLADEVRRRGEPVNVLGFSMGGLVVRAAHLVDPTIRFRRAVFLNSPHRGSWLAHALPLPGVRQMRPGSDFMQRLHDADWRFPTLATWCPADTMIVPGWYAKFDKAQENICCRMPAHIWPIKSAAVHRRVVEFLASV
jgi:triacylglycerol lipase